MKKLLIILLIPYFLISQDCIDDNYTMQVGLSVWTSGINGCEDGIIFLENAGYPCNTSLNTINNPFWGSNPNETLANICGCTCENQSIIYCQDNNACNYGEIGECEYIQIGECDCDGNFPDIGYDCNGDCLNDADNDGICDEFDNCIYNEVTITIEGLDEAIGWNITDQAPGGWPTASGSLGTFNLCLMDDCWNFNMYGSNNGWYETNYSIFYTLSNDLILSGNLINSNFCSVEIPIGDSVSCQDFYGCTDYTACNYNCQANIDDFSCEYPDLFYIDCNGNCLHDFDQDGICDELETNPCEQYPNPGPCFAAITVYFFNQENTQCEETIWGGCDGLVPFWTLE